MSPKSTKMVSYLILLFATLMLAPFPAHGDGPLPRWSSELDGAGSFLYPERRLEALRNFLRRRGITLVWGEAGTRYIESQPGRARRAVGLFSPSDSSIALRGRPDALTVHHELGHWLDHINGVATSRSRFGPLDNNYIAELNNEIRLRARSNRYGLAERRLQSTFFEGYEQGIPRSQRLPRHTRWTLDPEGTAIPLRRPPGFRTVPPVPSELQTASARLPRQRWQNPLTPRRLVGPIGFALGTNSDVQQMIAENPALSVPLEVAGWVFASPIMAASNGYLGETPRQAFEALGNGLQWDARNGWTGTYETNRDRARRLNPWAENPESPVPTVGGVPFISTHTEFNRMLGVQPLPPDGFWRRFGRWVGVAN